MERRTARTALGVSAADQGLPQSPGVHICESTSPNFKDNLGQAEAFSFLKQVAQTKYTNKIEQGIGEHPCNHETLQTRRMKDSALVTPPYSWPRHEDAPCEWAQKRPHHRDGVWEHHRVAADPVQPAGATRSRTSESRALHLSGGPRSGSIHTPGHHKSNEECQKRKYISKDLYRRRTWKLRRHRLIVRIA